MKHHQKAKAKSFEKALKAAIKDDKQAEEKAQKDSEKAFEKALKAAIKDDAKTASSAPPTAKAKANAKAEHGVELIENNKKSFWKKQNITVIKTQAELRGHRFTDLETKGDGVKSKFKKFEKKDYLEVLFEILKI